MANIDATLKAALSELEAERDRIDRQITAIKAALGETAGRRRGRPPGSGRKALKSEAPRRGPGRPKGTGKRKGGMSAEGRARVAAAQKARWAKIRGESGKE